MWDPYAEFKSTILPNGLSVYAAHWPNRQWQHIGFVVHCGSEQDPIGLEGISHLTEHLVSSNSTYNSGNISKFFENVGGNAYLGGTSAISTMYSFFVPADKRIVQKALEIYGQMLLCAKINNHVERERQVVLQEFNREYPLDWVYSHRKNCNEALYEGFWLERLIDPLGNKESILRISQQDLQSHYNHHYNPSNLSLVCVGGMSLSELVELIEKSPLAIRKAGVRNSLPDAISTTQKLKHDRQEIKLSNLVSGTTEVGSFECAAKIPGVINTQSLRVFEEMLNDVLNGEIREKRMWTYHTECGWLNYRHFYEFTISCEYVKAEAIDQIESVVEDCLHSLENRYDLFRQKKKILLASHLMKDLRGDDVLSHAMDDLSVRHRIITIQEMITNLNKVTMNDIRSLLQWLKPELRYTIIKRP